PPTRILDLCGGRPDIKIGGGSDSPAAHQTRFQRVIVKAMATVPATPAPRIRNRLRRLASEAESSDWPTRTAAGSVGQGVANLRDGFTVSSGFWSANWRAPPKVAFQSAVISRSNPPKNCLASQTHGPIRSEQAPAMVSALMPAPTRPYRALPRPKTGNAI